MNDAVYKFLNLIDFKDLTIWDVKRYNTIELTYNTKYPTVKFGTVLTESKMEWVKIEDEKEYSILGVRTYGKGVYVNRNSFGINLKMKKYQKSKSNHLFWCKVDTKNGAFGVITEEFENTYGSLNMSYLKIDISKININYLQLLFQQKAFNANMDNKVIGVTNRKYISKDTLLNDIYIPLPPLLIQEQIVDNYYSILGKADEAQVQAEELENCIDDVIFEELGIKKQFENKDETNNRFLNMINYSDTDRWSVDYLLNREKIEFISKGKYRAMYAKYFMQSYKYGLSEKADDNTAGIPMLRMNNIVDSNIICDKLKYIKSNDKIISKFLLKKGDLLFNRTNSKALVGKTAVFELDGIYTFASYLIRVEVNPKIANVHFINILFNSKIIRTQIDICSRQVLGQANINSGEMQKLLFPLPPLEIQKQIVDRIFVIKEKIKVLRNKAEVLRKIEKNKFEESIFGET